MQSRIINLSMRQKCHFGTNVRKKRNALDSILEHGKEFCAETNIHGFNHIAADGRHWIERVLWAVATAFAVWCAIDVSLGQWSRYNESPTVVTLAKDFRTWRFSLPAITACDKNKVNPEKLSGVIKRYWKVEECDEKYSYYEKFVNTVANSDLFHLEAFEEFKDDDKLNIDMFQLAVDVMPDIQVKVTWSESSVPKWIPIMTEVGACYVTNSLAVADVAVIKLHPNDTSTFPITCKYSSLSCYVILEAGIEADFYMHSPYDIPDTTMTPSTVFPTLTRVTDLSVMESTCGVGVRELSPKRRGCLYTDEPTDKMKKVYSTNSCRRSCRNRLAMKLCGCKPFYNFYEEGPMCTPRGMYCLSAYARVLTNIGGMQCSCRVQCVDSAFRDLVTKDQLWERGPFLNHGSVRYTVQAPRTRYTREIVFHFQDLVVSFGGAAGLFLGASFISFIEILYFIAIKILKPTFGNKAKVSVGSNAKEKNICYEATRIKDLTSILERQSRFECLYY